MADGLQRLLDFLNLLNQKKVHFLIEQQDDEGLRVTLTLVGARVEVVFTVDDMTYSIFTGHEDVLTDPTPLHDMIKEFAE